MLNDRVTQNSVFVLCNPRVVLDHGGSSCFRFNDFDQVSTASQLDTGNIASLIMYMHAYLL